LGWTEAKQTPMTSVVVTGRFMQLTTRLPKRRSPRPTGPDPAVPPLTPEAAETRDARRGGGPEDQALYSCMCGYAFKAKVTTSVDCPHCGVEQAW
jgi:hypothetical protein